MEKVTCEVCGKVIEGYSMDHCNYLLSQHQLAKHKHTDEYSKKEAHNGSK